MTDQTTPGRFNHFFSDAMAFRLGSFLRLLACFPALTCRHANSLFHGRDEAFALNQGMMLPSPTHACREIITPTRTRTHTYIYIYIYIYMCVCVCVCVCVSLCVCVSAHVQHKIADIMLISISSSLSSTSSHADCRDFLDAFSLPSLLFTPGLLNYVLCPHRKYICSCWSAITATFICRGSWRNVTNEFVLLLQVYLACLVHLTWMVFEM